MNDKRLTELTNMHERGTVRRGHIDEMLAELLRLGHNNTVLMNALMKACGDDEEMVKEIIESQGELK